MKQMGKNNGWLMFCQAFTVVAIGGMIIDIIAGKSINYSQFNMIGAGVSCLVAILVLSQTHRLERLSPLAVVVIQYGAAIVCMLTFTWLTGLWEPVHPNGYRDMVVSFTIPYVIGASIYYYELKQFTRKQNEDLQIMKDLIRDRKREG